MRRSDYGRGGDAVERLEDALDILGDHGGAADIDRIFAPAPDRQLAIVPELHEVTDTEPLGRSDHTVGGPDVEQPTANVGIDAVHQSKRLGNAPRGDQ